MAKSPVYTWLAVFCTLLLGELDHNVLLTSAAAIEDAQPEQGSYYGWPATSPLGQVPLGPRAVLLPGDPLPTGKITAFHAYLTGMANMTLQVWRPRPVEGEELEGAELEGSVRVMLVGKQDVINPQEGMIIVTPSPAIYLSAGDFLGFYSSHPTTSGISAQVDQSANVLVSTKDELMPEPYTHTIVFQPQFFYMNKYAFGATVEEFVSSEPLDIGTNGESINTGPGATGATGATGPRGSLGATGEKGPKGDTEIVGGTGSTGPMGPTGPEGDTGRVGERGEQGKTGSPGAMGWLGESGVKGEQGLMGHTGPQGHTGSQGPIGPRGPLFVDVDECADGQHQCQHECINDFGGYKCSCFEGYKLDFDGRTCIDVNECLDDNGGCFESCENVLGSYVCHCPRNTILGPNRRSCRDVRECFQNNGDCAASDLCIDSYGAHYCVNNARTELSVNYVKPQQQAAVSPNPQDSPMTDKPAALHALVHRDVVIGMFIWLVVLTLLLVALVCYAVVKRRRDEREKDMYMRYAHLLRVTPTNTPGCITGGGAAFAPTDGLYPTT